MASRQQLKRRINSVRNTRQITKAMEMVSASKLRRTQSATLASKDFTDISIELLNRLRHLTQVSIHPLYRQRKIKNRLLIVVASDGTLAGAYNYNVLKKFISEAKLSHKADVNVAVITVGKQATRLVSQIKDIKLIGAYHDFMANPSPSDIKPIIRSIIDDYNALEYDAVDVVYTKFISTVNLMATSTKLLPAAFEDTGTTYEEVMDSDVVFEPSASAVLGEITERFIGVQLMQYILESATSEHASRMIAMKNATDNAGDIIDDLTLAMNTARQAAITQELAEITGGAEALA